MLKRSHLSVVFPHRLMPEQRSGALSSEGMGVFPVGWGKLPEDATPGFGLFQAPASIQGVDCFEQEGAYPFMAGIAMRPFMPDQCLAEARNLNRGGHNA